MKRFLALLLCLLICVSLLPAAAFAEGSIELAEEDSAEEQGIIMQTEEAAEVNGAGAIELADDDEAHVPARSGVMAYRRNESASSSGRNAMRPYEKNSEAASLLKGTLRAAEETHVFEREFASFAELQDLIADYTPEDDIIVRAFYSGSGNLGVSASIEIPANMEVYVYDYQLVVQAGVTVTVSADARIVADDLYVLGTIVNEGAVQGFFEWENGQVTLMATLKVDGGGTIRNTGLVEYPYTLTGLDKIVSTGDGIVAIGYPIGSDNDFAAMVSTAEADSNVHHDYDAYAIRDLTISRSYEELPTNVSFYIQNAEVTVSANGCLGVRYSADGRYMSYICLYEYGTLRIKKDGILINESIIEVYSTAQMICESGAIYVGTGWLGVENSGGDIFSVSVIGLDERRFDVSYDEEKGFYGLVLKQDSYYLNKEELTLAVGKTETLRVINAATGMDASGSSVRWTSSDETVATVANGKVTAKKVGNAVITATAGSTTMICEVRVLFKDVTDSTEFYYDAIYSMVDKGVIGGYDGGLYKPMNNCNRAAVVTFLWRLAGRPTPAAMATFSDMTGNSDFDNAISWAAEEGITTGYAGNLFKPWNTCNRAAIVTFLWRFAGAPDPSSMATFSDMTGNSDFDNAISWAAENGITTGWDDNTFRPWKTCNRLAVASFLYRYDNLPDKKIFINLYSFTEEVPAMAERYMELHPEFAEKYTVRTTVLSTDEGYTGMLDDALEAGGPKAPDIYCAESAFVMKYTQGDTSGYAAPYEDFGLDVDSGISAAEIAQYTVDIGTRPFDGKVVGLGYQSTGGAFIYRRSIAEEVWGTDDPAFVEQKIGAGTQSWDKFWEVAEELKAAGYAIVSGDGDIWHAIENSSDTPWVVDGRLNIDPKREAFLDMSLRLKENGYHNETQDWSDAWRYDMGGLGEKQVFAFYGPAWLINYVMVENCDGVAPGIGTYGDWAVCESNVGFLWGGTWLMANKKDVGSAKAEGIAELLEWITLDASDEGLQYGWANGTWSGVQGSKDTVASAAVMRRSNGEFDFLGDQDMFEVFTRANDAASGRVMTQYDEVIDGYWRHVVRQYVAGDMTREEAIANFKYMVANDLGIEAD